MIRYQLIDEIVSVYGPNFKSPIARELEVGVGTIRRIFNRTTRIPKVYELAILHLIHLERAKMTNNPEVEVVPETHAIL